MWLKRPIYFEKKKKKKKKNPPFKDTGGNTVFVSPKFVYLASLSNAFKNDGHM